MEQTFIMKPKVDFCFKELMADEKVRRGFVAAVLGIRPEEITGIILMPSHLPKKMKEDKLGILDVRVEIDGKADMDIEIQVAPFRLWAERSLFYLSRMYASQIHEGELYGVLQKCIHVGILDFVLFKEEKEYYSRFHLWEDERRLLYTDKLEVHILELPKLNGYGHPDTELLRWAKFINAETREEFEMIAQTDEYLGRAYEKLLALSADEEKRLEYEAREKAIRDHNYLMQDNREQGREEGLREGLRRGLKRGMERGLKQGIERGLEQGMERGRQAGIKALAETCRELGLTKEDAIGKIAQKFGLSEEEAAGETEKYWE